MRLLIGRNRACPGGRSRIDRCLVPSRTRRWRRLPRSARRRSSLRVGRFSRCLSRPRRLQFGVRSVERSDRGGRALLGVGECRGVSEQGATRSAVRCGDLVELRRQRRRPRLCSRRGGARPAGRRQRAQLRRVPRHLVGDGGQPTRRRCNGRWVAGDDVQTRHARDPSQPAIIDAEVERPTCG